MGTTCRCIAVAVFLVGALLLGSMVGAQQRGVLVRPDPIPDFLARKKTAHETSIRALGSRGIVGYLPEVRRMVAAARLPPTGGDHAQRPQIELTFREDIAVGLTTMGFTATKIRRSQARGRDPIQAMARVTRGGASSEELLLLSDTVVIARTHLGKRSAMLGDGLYSSTDFKVIAVWKGSPKVGESIVIRQWSGRRPDGTTTSISGDLHAAPGTTYLLPLSRNLYEQRVAEHSRKARPVRSGYLLYGDAHEILVRNGRQVARVRGKPEDLDALRAQAHAD